MVVLDCCECIAGVDSGVVKLPCRYRDSAKSTCFAHFNVGEDFARAVGAHPGCKMHSQAIGREPSPSVGSPDQQDLSIGRACTFLAIRQQFQRYGSKIYSFDF
eukprot:12431527-Karenia_brevis.AAC.1